MGALLGFFVGWVVGARGGTKGYTEVVDAGREVVRSPEFRALLEVVRAHTGYTLRQLADWLEIGTAPTPPAGGDDLLSRVRALVTPGDKGAG